jgi:hypothetical protein
MSLDKLASATASPVYISEYDINVADDAKQQSVMESQFTMFWNDEPMEGPSRVVSLELLERAPLDLWYV